VKKFKNPYISNIRRTLWHFLKWQWGHYDDLLPIIKEPEDFTYPFPNKDLNKNDPRVIWINHCTFLIDIDGVKFLTDPIWAKRCSPLSFFGPKRRHEPAIGLKDLPKIDVVLISHNHYDHLDASTVKALNKRFPEIQWIVPKGLSSWFEKRGIKKVKELSWWEESAIQLENKELEFYVSATPTQHHSGRGIFDANKSLWVGFVVRAKRKNEGLKSFYFVGDTAYNQYDFKKIGEVFPSIDLCLCPIGTYKPGRFMRTVHSSPDDAVKIHQDVNAKLSVGMHWKTFKLSEEGLNRPPYDLYLAMKKVNLNLEQFLPLEPGVEINW
jgi:N-acyl-phosphatidylethanolamine-hydrolysing phospholipase D